MAQQVSGAAGGGSTGQSWTETSKVKVNVDLYSASS